MLTEHKLIYLLHILFVGPLFIYLGIQKNNVPKQLYSILFAIGISIMVYHSYKLYELNDTPSKH
jgi:hypothetical protein